MILYFMAMVQRVIRKLRFGINKKFIISALSYPQYTCTWCVWVLEI